jgi:DNA-binding transcriptional ArsR family regulator
MKQLDIEYLTELDRVTVLLHPLRLQIMELAIEGTSGTDAARRLGLPRQMVNYHVLALEKAGLLIRIGEVRRRNMVERRVQSSARAYLISPDILGPLSGARKRAPEPSSLVGLLTLTARIQSDIGSLAASREPAPALPVHSFSSKLQFTDESAQAAFVRALGESVVSVMRSSMAPGSRAKDAPAYNFILGLYPLPRPSSQSIEGDQR